MTHDGSRERNFGQWNDFTGLRGYWHNSYKVTEEERLTLAMDDVIECVSKFPYLYHSQWKKWKRE